MSERVGPLSFEPDNKSPFPTPNPWSKKTARTIDEEVRCSLVLRERAHFWRSFSPSR